jgi:hypothetical protein
MTAIRRGIIEKKITVNVQKSFSLPVKVGRSSVKQMTTLSQQAFPIERFKFINQHSTQINQRLPCDIWHLEVDAMFSVSKPRFIKRVS